jgi:hypothetical protein
MQLITVPPAAALLMIIGFASPSHLPGQQPAPKVTVAQFKQLKWLEGAWLGSGGNYPAFYEEYRAVDDSTIQMRAFSDSTFRKPTDSSRIELRGGIVSQRGGSQYTASLVQPDRIQFLPPGAARGGFTFTRVSADQWTATLHPSAPGGRETVYVMRRLRP